MKGALQGSGADGVGEFGLPGASVARTLGKEGSAFPKGGWGNVGSALTSANGAPVSPADPKGLTE